MSLKQLEMNRIRTTLAQLDERRQKLEAADDAPFVIFLTERMLADIEACRRSCEEVNRVAAWPSLN